MLFEGQFNALETRLHVLDGDGPTSPKPTCPPCASPSRRRISALYGYVLGGEPVEIQSLRLAAIGVAEPLTFPS